MILKNITQRKIKKFDKIYFKKIYNSLYNLVLLTNFCVQSLQVFIKRDYKTPNWYKLHFLVKIVNLLSL